MKKLHIVKIGGNVVNDSDALNDFLKKFRAIKGLKILVHGGGKLTTILAESLGVKQTIIDGRRVTDTQTLNIAVMVYAGLVNKTIVAKLQALHCNAAGYSGADGNLILSRKRNITPIDFGHVGDIVEDGIDGSQFKQILNSGIVPVICSVTHDGNGNLLNTNADSIASKIASELASHYLVSLIYCFEKKGVLMDIESDSSYLPTISIDQYQKLKNLNIISKGMIPKLDMAFDAFNHDVKNVSICHASDISILENQITGTQLIK